MSTPRGCIVIEAEESQWYCITALSEGDYDFHSASTNGPSPTADEALDDMDGPNPGSFEMYPYDQVTDYHRALLARFPPKPKMRWRYAHLAKQHWEY